MNIRKVEERSFPIGCRSLVKETSMRYTYVRQHDTTDCAAACLAMVCLHYKKGSYHYPPAGYDGHRPERHQPCRPAKKAANELGFTTAAVRVDRENFLSDFSLPCIAQVITDQGLAHFVVVFKKTTIKDDGARRKHMLQDAESRKEEEEKGKSISARITSSSATRHGTEKDQSGRVLQELYRCSAAFEPHLGVQGRQD